MATSSYDSMIKFTSERLAIPVGGTLAVYMQAANSQMSYQFKIISGGTLEIIASTLMIGATYPDAVFGSTMAAATLGALTGNSYPVGASEIVNVAGPAAFYLAATGATVVIGLMKPMN